MMIEFRGTHTFGQQWDQLFDPTYVNRVKNIDWVVIGSGEPVPPMRDIQAAGFDAIIQFRGDLLQQALWRDMRLLPVQIDYSDARNSIIEAEIDRILNAEPVYGEYVAWPPGPPRVLVDLEVSNYKVRFSTPKIQLEPGSPVRATVQWPITVDITAIETLASFNSRVDEASFADAPPPFRETLPKGLEPISVTRNLARGRVTSSKQIELEVEPTRYRVDAVFDYSDVDLTPLPGSDIFDELAEVFLRETIQDIFGSMGRVAIAPTILLGGPLRPDETLNGITRFAAIPVATGSNDGSHQVLSICIETGPGGRATDINRVRPFTGEQNYAYFVSEHIVAATILNWWNRASSRMKTLTDTISIRIPRDDGTVDYGHAEMRYELKTLDAAVFDVGTETLPDSIVLSGTVESQVLRAWFRDREVTSDIGDLREPHTEPFLLHVYLFDAPFDSGDEEVDRFLNSLVRYIIRPTLNPTDSWILQYDSTGSVKAPLSAVLTRGKLR
jgi:hypothetical protein